MLYQGGWWSDGVLFSVLVKLIVVMVVLLNLRTYVNKSTDTIFLPTGPSRPGWSVCLYVCHKSCNCWLWPNGQGVCHFFCKIYWVCMVLRILNLEEHQNCMRGILAGMVICVTAGHEKFEIALCCLNRNLTFFITTYCNRCKIKHCPSFNL